MEYFIFNRLSDARREMDIQETIPDGTTAMMIPNREIKDIFESTIIKWFKRINEALEPHRIISCGMGWKQRQDDG